MFWFFTGVLRCLLTIFKMDDGLELLFKLGWFFKLTRASYQ